GPITLLLEGAPELSLSPAEVPVGASKAIVILSAKSAEVAPAALVRHVRLTGTSVGLNPPLARVAAVPPDTRLSLILGPRADLAAPAGPTPGQRLAAELPGVFDPQIECVVRAGVVPPSFAGYMLASVDSPRVSLNVQTAVTVQLAASTLALASNSQAKFAGTV